MIPYIQVYDLRLGPLTLHPFGILVGAGVIIGVLLAMWRARKAGLDVDTLQNFMWWLLVGGFVGGHIFDALLYHPAEVIARPWSIFMIWEGLSSFGGFAGTIAGGLLWRRYERVPPRPGDPFAALRMRRRAVPMPVLEYSDVVQSVFPIAWVFGRAGCAVVHDHPGARVAAGSLLGVGFGPGTGVAYGFFQLQYGTAPRYDLGLLEMIFTAVIALAFVLTWSRRLPAGSYLVAGTLAYAPVRFALDFLRAEDLDGSDPRYGRLTPAQWSCIALFLCGLGVWRYMRAQSAQGAAGAPAAPPLASDP